MARNELVQSLIRAIDVVELVAQTERGLTLSEVCHALDMKSSTAHNILRTLVSRDLVERTTSPVRFRLGSAVYRLGDERDNHMVVRRASDIMRNLFERLKALMPPTLGPRDEASISFSQYSGGEVVMLLRLRMQRPGVLERPKHQMHPYLSAAPLCVQAMWSPEELEAYRHRHLFSSEGIHKWKSQERLDLFLQKVRELGYCKPPIFKPEEFRCAAPVWGEGHRLLGVLGVGIWLDKPIPNPKGLIKQMIECSKKIGQDF